jgi:hypothetical protein
MREGPTMPSSLNASGMKIPRDGRISEGVNDGLSALVREIVSRQYVEIKSNHDRIRNLRDAAKV